MSGNSATANQTIGLIDLRVASASEDVTSADYRWLWTNKVQGLTAIEWIVRRLQDSLLLDRVVVTGTPGDSELISSMNLAGACWMSSPYKTSVQRMLDIADRCNATWVALIPVDCPLIDPDLIDRLVSAAWRQPNADYVGYVGRDRTDIGVTRSGLCPQVYATGAVRERRRDIVDKNLLRLPSQNVDLFQMRLLPLPEGLQQLDCDLRLRSVADIEHLHQLLELSDDGVAWQQLLVK